MQPLVIRSWRQFSNSYCLKASEHKYIFSKYFFWKIKYFAHILSMQIFLKYKKPHFQMSVEIQNFTFQIKPVWFETRNFLMRLRDDTHVPSRKVVQFSRLPTPVVQLRPKFFHPLDLESPISNDPPSPLQMGTNHLKWNNPRWLLYVIRSFIQVGFRFQYQVINFVWLSIDIFSFS